ncbi:MAG TPA: 50S ribosomal protein L6 [Gammaproteobacteria bacterium]|nr:50S ribosomal protein L6 [Gammaproteobacteria bacterium]
MSRVAKNPIPLPKGVEVKLEGNHLTVKGAKGQLEMDVHEEVTVNLGAEEITTAPAIEAQSAVALAGTTRALINNMVIGTHEGFERKLELVGVGYRAQAKGKTLNINVGYSHPVDIDAPEGITFETPSQTEILVKGLDKQLVGQISANIRSVRPPEPYKGKGIRYSDEHVVRKEAKKK